MDSATTSDAPEAKLHFLDYWRVIRLRRSLILVVFLLCVMTSTLLTIWLPKKYASTVRIEVQKDTPEVSMLHPQQSVSIGTSDPYFLTTQFKIIESYSILTNVIEKLRLNEKLPEQLGQPAWTMDETFAYLSKMINVEQTRMTSLIEITVKNPNPQAAANIANAIADAYRESRKKQWEGTHTGGIDAYRSMLTNKQAQLEDLQSQLDEMRKKLGISELAPQSAFSETVESKMLQIWAERDVVAKADYIEYSNILFTLDQIPHDKLGSELPTAYRNLSDMELTEKSEQLTMAQDMMMATKREYGVENPKYKSVSDRLDHAQQEYNNKVDAIVAGIRTRVAEDLALVKVIEQNENEIRTNKNIQDELYRPYYQLKDKVDNLRYNNRESERYLNQEIAEAGQPDAGIVIVRDPGRPGTSASQPQDHYHYSSGHHRRPHCRHRSGVLHRVSGYQRQDH